MKHALLIGLLLLAACTAQTSEDVVKIGFVGPLTGEAAAYGETWHDAVQMAADDINAKGGINGKPVEIIYEDGQCTGKQASIAIQTLQNVHKVDAVIGYCSPEVLAIAPAAEETNTLIIAPGATAADITHAGPHVFRLAPTDNMQGAAMAMLLRTKEYERIGLLYLNNDYGLGLQRTLDAELGDVIVVTESYEQEGASDSRTQLTKIQNADIDVLILIAFPKPGSIILEQIQELGIDVPIISSEAIMGEDVLSIGEGIIFTAPLGEGDSFEAFSERYEGLFGRAPGIFDGESYDAVHLIKQAIENNPENPVAGMEGIPEYDGVAGHVVFDENGDVSKPYNVFTIRDETFVKIDVVELN